MLVAQSCPILCDPMDCSPPGSSVHGISQARILEWVAIPFSRGSSRPRVWTWVSCIAGRFFTVSHQTWESNAGSSSLTPYALHPCLLLSTTLLARGESSGTPGAGSTSLHCKLHSLSPQIVSIIWSSNFPVPLAGSPHRCHSSEIKSHIPAHCG